MIDIILIVVAFACCIAFYYIGRRDATEKIAFNYVKRSTHESLRQTYQALSNEHMMLSSEYTDLMIKCREAGYTVSFPGLLEIKNTANRDYENFMKSCGFSDKDITIDFDLYDYEQ